MSWHDPAQIGQWFEAYGPRLVLYARQWVGSAADDVVQDAFVSLIGLKAPPDHEQAWLFRAVRNAAFSRLRTRKRRKQREAAVAVKVKDMFIVKPNDLLDAEEVSELVIGLPDDQREVVVLRIWGQLTLEATAEVVGTSVATVFRRYQAGLESIRKSLEQDKTQDKKQDRDQAKEQSCQSNTTRTT